VVESARAAEWKNKAPPRGCDWQNGPAGGHGSACARGRSALCRSRFLARARRRRQSAGARNSGPRAIFLFVGLPPRRAAKAVSLGNAQLRSEREREALARAYLPARRCSPRGEMTNCGRQSARRLNTLPSGRGPLPTTCAQCWRKAERVYMEELGSLSTPNFSCGPVSI
jgi:hypothetical protein